MDLKIRDVMRPITVLDNDAPVTAALSAMQEIGVDLIPIGTPDNIEGMVSMSDVAAAAAANPGASDNIRVGDVKSPVIGMCNEDQNLADVLATMKQCNDTGLLVRNAEGKLTGVVGLKQVVERLMPDPPAATPTEP